MLIVGMVFEGILHQVASSTDVVESDVVRIMAQPTLQCLSVHPHQSIGGSHPDIPLGIHVYAIGVDELAHQTLAITKMLQVLHLIVQAIQPLVGGYPVIPLHVVQEPIALAAHKLVGHLQLPESGHCRIRIEYLSLLWEEHQTLMPPYAAQVHFRIEETFWEMSVLECLRSCHIERYALRTSPSVAFVVESDGGDTTTNPGIVLGISHDMSLAIPHEDTLTCAYPQLAVSAHIKRGYRGCRQQRFTRNTRDSKGLRIQDQQASIVGTDIILSLVKKYIGNDMSSQ